MEQTYKQALPNLFNNNDDRCSSLEENISHNTF